MCRSINNSVQQGLIHFPHGLKMLILKGNFKGNYRLVSILPVPSKLYEKSLCKQMSSFFEEIFSKQCGIRQVYNTQQCLLTMLEKWERSADWGVAFDAFFIDLIILNHEFIIAKLNQYGMVWSALNLTHDYLSHRKQGARINMSDLLQCLGYLKGQYWDHFYLHFFGWFIFHP